jgi:hypothetical protein
MIQFSLVLLVLGLLGLTMALCTEGLAWWRYCFLRGEATAQVTDEVPAAFDTSKGTVLIRNEDGSSNPVESTMDRSVGHAPFYHWLFERGKFQYVLQWEAEGKRWQGHYRYLKKKGIWEEADDHVPKPGDLIFYDWQDDSGKGDNTGNPDHVGIVEKISGDTIIVIEGNYANSVMRRHIRIGARYIRGYGVPKYTVSTTEPVPDKKEEGFTMKMRYLSRGCKGEDVKGLQILLNGRGYNCGTVDGDFGSRTDKALRLYQSCNKLEVDGVAGPQTMGSLLGVEA